MGVTGYKVPLPPCDSAQETAECALGHPIISQDMPWAHLTPQASVHPTDTCYLLCCPRSQGYISAQVLGELTPKEFKFPLSQKTKQIRKAQTVQGREAELNGTRKRGGGQCCWEG